MARKGSYGKRRGGTGWALPVISIAIAIIVVVAVVRGLGPKQTGSGKSTPVSAAVMKNLTQIPLSTWNAVQLKGTVDPPTFVGYTPATASATVTAAAGAKPLLLYVGAEYCPYCAAERWAMVAALGRFGTFHNLSYSHSADDDAYPNTPTFTFYGSTYDSPYITLQTVETTTNVRNGALGYKPLQKPTQAQAALYDTYNHTPYFSSNIAGHIPFLLIARRYAWVGSSFSPQVLKGATQAQIAAGLPAGTSTAARAILANANEIAAAVCAVDGGQPASVCGSSGVKAAAKFLPTGPKS